MKLKAYLSSLLKQHQQQQLDKTSDGHYYYYNYYYYYYYYFHYCVGLYLLFVLRRYLWCVVRHDPDLKFADNHVVVVIMIKY